MKTLKGSWVLSLIFGSVTLTACAQPVVGFYDLAIFTGNNLIANQLSSGSPTTDTLDNVLVNGVPNGATFAEFNTAENQLMPLSVFNASLNTWSINYTFGPTGLGGVLNSPSAATIRFGGDIENIDDQGNYTFNPPVNGAGTYLLALAAPLDSSTGNGTFQEIVGRAPNVGDSVETLNGQTQSFTTTTFNGSTWNNGTPSLGVGQSAYFILGVPEPSAYALGGLSVIALVVFRSLRLQKTRQ